MKLVCPRCGREIEVERKFVANRPLLQGYCQHCDAYVVAHYYKCVNCGTYTWHVLKGSHKPRSKKVIGVVEEWKCTRCGSVKNIFSGFKGSYERSIMPTR